MKMDKITLRTSDFMDIVGSTAASCSALNTTPLQSLENKIKLVPSGDYKMPVDIYIPVGTRLSAEQTSMMTGYQRAASQAYSTLQKDFKIITDYSPSGLQRTLPERDALSQVRQWIMSRRADSFSEFKNLQELIMVLPKNSRKQIDFFVEYKTQLPKEAQEWINNLRMMAQRIYAEILYHRGIQPERPVASIHPLSQKSRRPNSDSPLYLSN